MDKDKSVVNYFLREPLEIVDGISVYSKTDSYIDNYEQIATDHLAAYDATQTNPFMVLSQMQSAEESTRRLLRRHAAINSLVLDAGVGPGDLLGATDEFQRFGIDISLEYLKRARLKGINVAFATLEEMPYCDDVFDVVVTTDVLEHVLRLDDAATQLVRVVKPGGLVIIRVPNDEALQSYLDTTQPYKYSHIRKFDLPSLRLYFEKTHNLSYVEHEYSVLQFLSVDQLKIRLPSLKSPLHQILGSEEMQYPALNILRAALKTSEEELVDVLIAIRDEHPEIMSKIFNELVKPVEITVVFRKKI